MKKKTSLNRIIFITIFAVCLFIAICVTITMTYLAFSSSDNTTSLESFLLMSSTQLVAFVLVILLVSLVVSSVLTQIILKPFKEIDLNHPLKNDTYTEIQPLLNRVEEQRQLLKTQNKQLEQTNSLRREFTGNVSHEMKTPLQVISGYAELMENGLIPESEIKANAHLIREEAKSMRDLIDDVLTLSKLDEGTSKSAQPIDLCQTVKNAIDRLESKAKENNVSLTSNLPPTAIINGDSSLADQMVNNLVDNAIKYNRRGGSVFVSVECLKTEIKLIVRDNGVGIPKNQRERIFERFYRVDESRSRETGGTGLGLAIVKHAVESFGGKICVEDNKTSESGSEFVVRIPTNIN